jgi:hypothetical protein
VRIVEANSSIEFNQALVDYAKDIGNRIDLSVSSHATSEHLIMNFDPPKELWKKKINYVDKSDFAYLKAQGIEITRAHFSGCSAAGVPLMGKENIVQAASRISQTVATGYTSGTASSLTSAFEYEEGKYVRVSMKDGKFVYDPKEGGYILQYLYADELIEYSNGKILNRRTRGSRRWQEQLEE